MVSVNPKECYCLRFLWVFDVIDKTPELYIYSIAQIHLRSLWHESLLNATINYHLDTYMYRHMDPSLIFFDKFLSSIYVDDMSL